MRRFKEPTHGTLKHFSKLVASQKYYAVEVQKMFSISSYEYYKYIKIAKNQGLL